MSEKTNADRFTSAITHLDQSLSDADKMIHVLKFGVSAEVVLGDGVVLVWCRITDKHRRTLHVELGGKAHKISSATVQTRLLSAHAIPELIDNLRARRADMAGSIAFAANALDAYLAEVSL